MQMMCNIMIDCDAKYSMEHLIEVMVGANLRIKNNYGYMIAYREDDRRYYKTEGDLVKDFQERIIEAAIFGTKITRVFLYGGIWLLNP